MIVLSSGSATRRRLLSQTGIYFKTAQPRVDEAAIKDALRKAGAGAGQVAESLAESKASAVGVILPGHWVIGADQMLDCDGAWFDKPADLDGARRQLRNLRGRAHELVTAAVIAHEGRVVWRTVETARLVMRDFSDEFLERYVERAGNALLGSVGAYQLEGLGAQLFDKVEGDFFSILGLPVISVLAALREAGALPR